MCCNLKTVEGVKAPADCKCYAAVLRTFTEMIRDRVSRKVASEAALRVYQFHHPEDAFEIAKLTVDRWISARNVH